MALTAGTSSHVLIAALRRAGWGNLAGPEFRGVTGVLETLTLMLDPKSGQGRATAPQIAEQSRYTERWVRRCLHVLEDLELIEWQRGGIADGKPVPSWFRISKRALLILVSIARTGEADRRAERDAATRERVAKYRLKRTGRGRKRRPDHAEVVTALLFNKEVPRAERAVGPAPDDLPSTREAMKDAVTRARAGIREAARLKALRGKESKTATTTGSAARDALHGPISAHNHAAPTGGSAQ
jgi:hypothetical protein